MDLHSLSQKQLNLRLIKERKNYLPPPPNGWIRTIRQNINMAASQLAKRLGITKQAMARIEKADRDGKLNLSTLQRIAEALQCDVKVILVPKKSLEQMLHEQAFKVAKHLVEHTEFHMGLEKQTTNASFQEERIRQLAEDLIRSRDRRLWQDF